MPKRKLTKLRIREVSSVPAGAGDDCRVLIAKADDTGLGGAGGVVGRRPTDHPMTIWEHQEAARGGSWKKKVSKMSKTYAKMCRAFDKAARPPAPPPPLDTAKLAQQVAKGLAAGEPFERAATKALRKVGGREPFAGVRPTTANTAVTTVEFDTMMAKAQEVADATGETKEQAFARVYADPRNRETVQKDKERHLRRAYGAALPLPSSGPGLRPDQQPVVGDELTKRVLKLRKRDPALTFEQAATQALRGRAA
jgi:hypothetical protein